MFKIKLWLRNTFSGVWINPFLFGPSFNKHKWWHFIFMNTINIGVLHYDKPGYINNYIEKKCTLCKYIEKKDSFLLYGRF